jgi:hypothetical protein
LHGRCDRPSWRVAYRSPSHQYEGCSPKFWCAEARSSDCACVDIHLTSEGHGSVVAYTAPTRKTKSPHNPPISVLLLGLQKKTTGFRRRKEYPRE